jgi:hypothetical protein
MLKPLGLMLEVFPDESNLIRFGRILRDNTLNAPELSHLENVHSPGHVEWHYAMRHLMHMLLGCLRLRRGTAEQ